MTQKKYNVIMVVVSLTLLEGLVIYLNMVAHPDSQPVLTLGIVFLFSIASGLGVWYWTRVRGVIFS
jgi:hypothetical protein